MIFWITVRLHKCVCMTYSSCFIMLFMNYTCRAIWASQVSCCHTIPNRYCGKFHIWCIQKSVQQCVTSITASLHISVQLHLWWQIMNSKSVFRTVELCPAECLTDSVAIHTFEFRGLPKAYSMHKQTYVVDSIGCSDFSDMCTVSNCRVIMNNELRGMWKRTCMAYFEVLSHQLPVLTKGIHDEPQTWYTVYACTFK